MARKSSLYPEIVFAVVLVCHSPMVIMNVGATPTYVSQCGSASTLEANTRVTGNASSNGLAQAVQTIFRLERPMRQGQPKSCGSCHNSDEAAGGIQNVLDFAELRRTGLVNQQSPKESRLYRALARTDDRFMPRGGQDRLTTSELETIERWMAADSPSPQSVELARIDGLELISETDVVNCIYTDLRRLNEAERRITRYFTFTHLYNARLGEELSVAREALSKLVNSLSWEERIIRPIAVDPARTIFRISLGAYGWDVARWKRTLTNYPYGIKLDYGNARYVFAETESGVNELPYVRGDWFLFEASKPPLYHDILQLPSTSIALESRLGVGVENNVERGVAARAGFGGRPVSGVATHNRVIERHPIGASRAYWKSYDFSSDEDRQNIFEHPTDFDHAGGEIIFNLPNGLQAYLLTLANGNRIDAAPVNIVQGQRRRDGKVTITNGISCMGCHTHGVNRNTDQIRQHVQNHPDLFNHVVTQQVQSIYRVRDEMNRLFADDERRFRDAIAAVGSTVDRPADPIFTTVESYDTHLNIARFAAELGISVGDFRAGLGRNTRLARQLGFETPGRTISRRLFDQLFATNAAQFHLGPVVSAGPVAPLVQGAEENYLIGNPVTWDRRTEACSTFGREWSLVNQPEQLDPAKRWEVMGRNDSVRVWTSTTREGTYTVTCGVRLPAPRNYMSRIYSIAEFHRVRDAATLSQARYSNMNICVYTNGLATGEQSVAYSPRRATVVTLRSHSVDRTDEVVEHSEGAINNLTYPVVCVNRPQR